MSSQETQEFTPPPHELGGENLVDLLSMWLFSETLGLYMRDYGITNIHSTSLPIFKDAQKIIDEEERIGKHLQSLHLYFHEPDGSVFMDYKIMRGKRFPDDRMLSSWEKEHIEETMPTQQALDICKKEVATWWNLK